MHYVNSFLVCVGIYLVHKLKKGTPPRAQGKNDMTLQEFKTKARKQGFTRSEMWDGIEVEGIKFTIDTCMGGRYWTVSCKDLTKDGSKWETLCTRALISTAFKKVDQRVALNK